MGPQQSIKFGHTPAPSKRPYDNDNEPQSATFRVSPMRCVSNEIGTGVVLRSLSNYGTRTNTNHKQFVLDTKISAKVAVLLTECIDPGFTCWGVRPKKRTENRDPQKSTLHMHKHKTRHHHDVNIVVANCARACLLSLSLSLSPDIVKWCRTFG